LITLLISSSISVCQRDMLFDATMLPAPRQLICRFQRGLARCCASAAAMASPRALCRRHDLRLMLLLPPCRAYALFTRIRRDADASAPRATDDALYGACHSAHVVGYSVFADAVSYLMPIFADILPSCRCRHFSYFFASAAAATFATLFISPLRATFSFSLPFSLMMIIISTLFLRFSIYADISMPS
jgi:hypothetical protein